MEAQTDKKALFVNALRDAMMARAREGLLRSPGMDTKRPAAWCEYGWPEEVSSENLFMLYRRGGLAHGAVNKLAGTCWRTYPEIIQGEKSDESRSETPWEKRVKREVTNRFWRAFAEADKMRLAGRYAGLVLHINDNRHWDQPAHPGKRIVKVTPAWGLALKVGELVTDVNSEDYGKPKSWQYNESALTGTAEGRRVTIHPDRIIILGDWSAQAIGFLEPAYNAFVSIEKVEGGAGESFLKNAARQLAVSFEKDIDFKSLANAYGIAETEIHTVLNEAARDINSANDLLLLLQGADVTPLVSNIPDPTPTYNTNLQTVSCSLDIPSRVLVGNQQGERASTEDNRYFNSRCQSRRNELSFEIEDAVMHLQRIKVLDAVEQFSVVWDDLNEQTPSERLDAAKKMSEINSTAIATGEAIFAPEELRVAAGFEPDGAEKLPEVEPEDLDDEDGEEA